MTLFLLFALEAKSAKPIDPYNGCYNSLFMNIIIILYVFNRHKILLNLRFEIL